MPPDLMTIDPTAYFSASANLTDVGDALWGDVSRLGSCLTTTGSMAGSDPGGRNCVGLAWLTVGVSAAASAAIAAGRFSAAAKKVRDLIEILGGSRRTALLEDGASTVRPLAPKLHEIAERPKVDLDGNIFGGGRTASSPRPIIETPQQLALEYNSRAERLDHTFADKHGLNGLIDDLGGRENVVRDMLAELDRRALTPGRFEEVVTIEGVAVTVRGAVVNGVTKIGTAFIP